MDSPLLYPPGAEVCLAVDLGAGSGRVIAAAPGGELMEIHRFKNGPVSLGGSLCWDFPELWSQVCFGIRRAAVDLGLRVRSIGVDTWGVDFGLVSAAGTLLSNPLCYRDGHTAGLPERLAPSDAERRARFRASGIYPNQINTLYQLVALAERDPELLSAASTLLFMPDLIGFYLTGARTVERSIASTSEMLLAGKPEWDFALIRRLGLPERIFPPIVEPGAVKGAVLPEIADSLGLSPQTVVVAVGSHDTASAVYASRRLHAAGPRTAFLSSGTWSLLGLEIPEPIVSDAAFDAEYTNEAGVGAQTCLLQNIPGMWVLQNLVKKWEAEGRFPGYDALLAEAEAATIDSTFSVDDPRLIAPADMEAAIAALCREAGLREPKTAAEFARVALRSLAARYGRAVEGLNATVGPDCRPEALNIVGGGSLNRFLNRLTAEATGLQVIAGPVEATAIGNLTLQFETLGI